MTSETCEAIQQVILAMIREAPAQAGPEALDLLSPLDREEKRGLWRWMATYDPTLYQWFKSLKTTHHDDPIRAA